MQIMQDYYKILGVTPDASLCQIKEAYRTLAFRYHPDRNQNNIDANQKMMEINVANDTLSNPAKRKQYDVPMGYHVSVSKFKAGNKVIINSHSPSPYRGRTGVVDTEPVKDTFRYWYMVRFDSKSFSTVNRFAEEELSNTIPEQTVEYACRR
jgi:curved DNA-binding protein CbpA